MGRVSLRDGLKPSEIVGLAPSWTAMQLESPTSYAGQGFVDFVSIAAVVDFGWHQEYAENQSGSAGEQPDRTKGRAVFSAGNRGPFPC